MNSLSDDPSPDLVTADAEVLRLAVKSIEEEPTSWNQEAWAAKGPCGTTMCLAGHIVHNAGYTVDFYPHGVGDRVVGGDYISDVAQKLAGLTEEQASTLFSAVWVSDVEDLKKMITVVTGVTFD